MNSINTIGFDIAKNVFQVHGIDDERIMSSFVGKF